MQVGLKAQMVENGETLSDSGRLQTLVTLQGERMLPVPARFPPVLDVFFLRNVLSYGSEYIIWIALKYCHPLWP